MILQYFSQSTSPINYPLYHTHVYVVVAGGGGGVMGGGGVLPVGDSGSREVGGGFLQASYKTSTRLISSRLLLVINGPMHVHIMVSCTDMHSWGSQGHVAHSQGQIFFIVTSMIDKSDTEHNEKWKET